MIMEKRDREKNIKEEIKIIIKLLVHTKEDLYLAYGGRGNVSVLMGINGMGALCRIISARILRF